MHTQKGVIKKNIKKISDPTKGFYSVDCIIRNARNSRLSHASFLYYVLFNH